MRNLSILMILFLLSSCLDSQGSGKRYPIEQTHGHQHGDHESHQGHEDHEHESNSPLGVNNPIKGMNSGKEDAFSSDNRDLWQRPDLIIYHLGNLEGKTMADVGAGPVGYFSFIVAANTNVKKVLALDIDKEAIAFMDEMKVKTKNLLGDKIETRLVKPEDPLLNDNEVEVILISSTLTYITNKIAYLKDLRDKMPVGGRLVIVDYKMKEIPDFFPPREQRIPLFEMENLIDEAGFKRIVTDDTTLKYQYIVVALNP